MGMPVNLLHVVTFCEYPRMLQTAAWMWLFTTMKDTVTSPSSALSEHANPIRPKPNSQTSTTALRGKCGSEVCCQSLVVCDKCTRITSTGEEKLKEKNMSSQ